MNNSNEVLFECKYADTSMIPLLATVLIIGMWFLMMAMLAESLIGTLFMLALLSGAVVWGIRETVQNSQMKIQVREQEIRIEQKNGEILRSISLSDVAGVSADINGDVYVHMLTSETGTCQTLVGIEKPDSFASLLRIGLDR